MALINGTPITQLARGYRVVHLAGRYGSGKTAFAYRLAYELLEHHGFRYLLSNCEDVWGDDPADVQPRPDMHGDPTYLDTVVILDEAGIVFEGASHARQFVAFMRKFNVCLLLPSVESPPARVRFLQVTRKYNFDALGLPLWWYEARLSTGLDRVKYQFGWWRPSEIFGVYDTSDFPADDSDIGAWLQGHVERKTNQRKKRSRTHASNRLSSRALSPVADGWGDTSAFEDAALEVSDAVSLLAEWQTHARKRGR
jgi:hypothetical protein